MEENAVIRVEGLGKKYIIGHQKDNESYAALRDVFGQTIKRFVKSCRNMVRGEAIIPGNVTEEFWALRNINLEIKRGEVVGVIGRNGAGKSTLLKVLSRITDPSEGRVEIRGRLASLLEVGTGFHPELTGRENIYLNGAILGMSRAEVRRKFDEIVDFAEVERFLDTPVKRYSSGMYVRLAFSVAAHLEPDILVVDEVLAVGDAEFQKKCIGKMQDVAGHGRTVLFVSHNMAIISSLCSKAILLEQGKVAKIAETSEAILDYYTQGQLSPAQVDFTKLGKTIGDDYAQLLEASIITEDGEVTTDIECRQGFSIEIKYRIHSLRKFRKYYPFPSIHFYAANGECAVFSTPHNDQMDIVTPGDYVVRCQVPAYLFNAGTYFVGLGFSDCDNGVQIHFHEKSGLSFHVSEEFDEKAMLSRNGYADSIPGMLRPRLDWVVSQCAS